MLLLQNVKEDILSRFLEASKKDPDQMTDQYLRDIILNFMIAGKDSTANTISWFVYMLCKNPLIQEKILQEVKDFIAETGDEVDVDNFVDQISDETLDKMHYLHASLTETLRLYPAVPVVNCGFSFQLLTTLQASFISFEVYSSVMFWSNRSEIFTRS